MKFDTLKVRGRQFDVHINSAGHFHTEFDGDTITKPTLEDLRQRLLDLTKQKAGKIAIEFHRWVEDPWNDHIGKLKHGVITGLHAANGNVMVKFDGEKAEQDSSWHNSEARFLRLNPKEVSEYCDLQAKRVALEKEIKKFEEAHSFDADEAVKAIIAKTA